MDLIKELLKHKTPYNTILVKDLIDCINSENIKTIKDLENLENKYFSINGKVLTDEKKIESCYINMANAYYDYDNLTIEETLCLKDLKDSILTDISIEDKILNIIKINMLTKREIMFFKRAYDFISKGLI